MKPFFKTEDAAPVVALPPAKPAAVVAAPPPPPPPPAPPPPPPPRNHAARLAAIESMKGRHANELLEFDAARNQARGKIQASQLDVVASAAREAESTRKALAKALLEDLERRLYPLCARFADAPRSSAGEIATIWRELDARAQEELGLPLAHHHVGLAMVATQGVAALRSGHARFWENGVLEASGQVVAAILTTGGSALVEARLRDLEIAIEVACRLPAHQDAAGLEARKSCATQNDLAQALAPPPSRPSYFQQGDPDRFKMNHTNPFQAR